MANNSKKFEGHDFGPIFGRGKQKNQPFASWLLPISLAFRFARGWHGGSLGWGAPGESSIVETNSEACS